jgi:heme/copper-type cytochrome/quinol oxidase subunit 2
MKIFFLFLLALFVAASMSSARACAACWGDTTGSKMSNAADVGIIAMVIIMFFMLGAIGAFIWHLAYRAKHPLPDYNELLREDDGHARPGTV